MKRAREDDTEYDVEEVSVIETKTILVRFPCFDFFRNVHLAEREERKQDKSSMGGDASATTQTSDGAAASEATTDTSQPPTYRFAPDSVRFVPGTLQTAHPVLVVRTRDGGDGSGGPVFVGSWEEVATAATGSVSNRVIVHLQPSEDDAAVGAHGGRQTQLPTLLPHAPEGVGRDDSRQLLERWRYVSAEAPAAVLTMRRVR